MRLFKVGKAGYLVFASTTENTRPKKLARVNGWLKTGQQSPLITSVSTFLSMMACIQVSELARPVSLKGFQSPLEPDEVAMEESIDLEPSVK